MYKENDEDILLFDPVYLKQKEYWKEKLSGGFAETDIFVNDRESGFPGQEYGKKRLVISGELSEMLVKLSKKSDLSLYIILLAACKVLIYRNTGNEDIIVLSPLYQQNVSENTINNYVLIRDAVDGRKTFKELLFDLRQSVLEAFSNQDYPFDKLLEFLWEIPWQGEGNKTPSHILCSLANIHARENIAELTPKFSFSFAREGEQVYGELVYDINAVDTWQVQQTAAHFTRILDESLKDVNTCISDISYISEEERKQLIINFNDNSAFYYNDCTIHHLVRQHAEAAADRAAVVSEGKHLSYGELNKKAVHLSVILRKVGVRKDKTVGILMERGLSMVIGILATWKAGGAYIPIDTQYPAKRTTGILEDSGAVVLLTRADYLAPGIERTFPGAILEADAENEEIDRISSTVPDEKIDINTLSYVIYTSGSTGKPKGAMVEHIGMMNHICAKIKDLRVTEKSIVVQNSNHTFDISVWQFFTALVKGGKTIIYSNRQVLDPHRFVTRLMDDRVTILEVVPSYLSVILDILNPYRDRLRLEFLLVTGEEVKASLVMKWFEKYPGIKMVNAYGPTEASDDITHYIMDKAPGMRYIPIGKPVQNLNIYIVDNHMQLCPIGVRGEIWVSGVGVGRGYLNQPELTAGKFIEYRSYRSYKTYIFYKTGDLGSWLPDGTIAFWGRKDQQVKIRGFRIEPGEIESQLLKHPGVKEAVVIDREDDGEDKFLCAYLVLNGNTDFARIKESFAESLPYYMIPAYYILLEKMPLTPNGKVDKRALRHMEVNTNAAAESRAPEGKMEEKLVEVWSSVLGIAKDNISTNANFFESGGQSLKATILVSKIHKAFDVKVPLTEIFKNPTIRELSRYLKGIAQDRFTAVEPAEELEYYALSSAQERLYVLQQMDEKSTAYNIPIAVSLKEVIDRDRLESTVKKLIKRHESFRTSVELVDEKPVQRVHDEVEFKIQYFDLTTGAGGIRSSKTGSAVKKEEIHNPELRIRNSFIRPFDLSNAPLLRVGLIHTSPPDGPTAQQSERSGSRSILLVDMHHIISDGASMDIVIREFWTLYADRELPPLKFQYKDYSRWQDNPRQRKELEKQEEYWLSQFKDDIPILNLPIDYQRTDELSFKGDSLVFEIEEQRTTWIKEFILEEGVTLNIFLLAVYNVLLAKFTGQDDILVGSVISGRRHADFQNIIGFFVNMLALRNRPSENKTFPEFLKEVKENALTAYENQDYPFEKLVSKLEIQREAGRHPLIDTVFVFQTQEGQADEAPVLKEELKQNPYNISHFDLMFLVNETGDSLEVTIEYSTVLFKHSTIAELSKCYIDVLGQVVENKEIRLKEIELSHDFVTMESDIQSQESLDFEF
jgi:amino acid adenylation domain-containing protein